MRYRCANNTTFHIYHLHSDPNNALVSTHSTKDALKLYKQKLKHGNMDCLLVLSTHLNSFKHFWKITYVLNVVARRIHDKTTAKISPDIILL